MSDLKYQDITESLSIVKKQALEEQRGSLQPVAVRGKNPSGVNFPKPPGRGGTPRGSALGAINRDGKGHGKVTKLGSKSRDDQPVSGAINDMVDKVASGQTPNYPATAAVFGAGGVGGGAVIADRMKKKPPYGNEFDIQEDAPNPKIARQARPPAKVSLGGGIHAPVGPSAEGIYKQGLPLSIDPDYINAVNRANSANNLKTGMAPGPMAPLHKIKNAIYRRLSNR